MGQTTLVKSSRTDESCEYSAVKYIRDQWLVWSPDIKHSRTPFGRIHNVLHIVSQPSYSLGTTTCFDVTLDGQQMRHRRDEGTHWCSVDFSRWPTLVHELMESLEKKISTQLPEGVLFSDLLTFSVTDDLSPNPPHEQNGNGWMTDSVQLFRCKIMSDTEQRHNLTSKGKLQVEKVQAYLRRDQEIRGLIATIVATTTSVCLRSFQFKSIRIGSDSKKQRNVWLLDGRFFIGKAKAKQRSIGIADVLYWLPRKLTAALSVLFYLQQPFINDVLATNHRQYAVYLWPLWPARSDMESDTLSLWSGVDINKAVQKYTKTWAELPLDCQTIRQIAEGLLHQKVPMLFEPYNTSRDRPPSGTYHIDPVLQQYARTCGLERLVEPTMMDKDKIAAVLLVSDIWQSLIKVEPNSMIWLPLATDMYTFPATLHNDLAYVEAQQLKVTMMRGTITLQSLTKGLKLLEHPDFFDRDVSPCVIKIVTPLIDLKHPKQSENTLACAHIYMRVVRCLLFGTGGPRYAQRPPLGGIIFQDLVEAGAMVNLYQSELSLEE